MAEKFLSQQLEDQKRKFDNEIADARKELQQEIKKGNEYKQANARLELQINEIKNQKTDLSTASKKRWNQNLKRHKNCWQMSNLQKTSWLQDKDKIINENGDLKAKLDAEATARQGVIRKLETQQKESTNELNNQKAEFAKLTKKYNESLESKKVLEAKVGELKNPNG